MRIAYLNYEASIGRRFNGLDLANYFNGQGHGSVLYSWYVSRHWPDVCRLLSPFPGRGALYGVIRRLERWLSLQNVLYPPAISYRRQLRRADVLHVHLISQYYFNWMELILLSRMKPTVMTLHEFSPFTGHCVYPRQCSKWQTGCLACPTPEAMFSVRRRGAAAALWNYKKFVYGHSQLDLVVASRWMLNKVNQSPLLAAFEKHLIPFGLDLDVFRPRDKAAARRRLGIFPNHKVVMFRALNSPFKGIPDILEALTRLDSKQPLCILTVNEQNLATSLLPKYQVRELGTLTSQKDMALAYNAADIFLMPSTDETFGMMAMEAMACGVPCVVTEDTPLTDVTFAPQAAVAIPQNDPLALEEAIKLLLENADLRHKMSARARELAEQHYDFTFHAKSLMELYQYVIAKRSRNCRTGCS